MATTQYMQNKGGNRAGLAVDEGKLKLEGGKYIHQHIPITDDLDETDSIGSWEDDFEEEERVPGGGTPAQIAADQEEQEIAQQLAEIRKEQEAKEAKLLEQKKKAEANRQKQIRNTPTKPVQEQDELDFGSYA